MTSTMNTIMDKSDWSTQLMNENITKKWRGEFLSNELTDILQTMVIEVWVLSQRDELKSNTGNAWNILDG